MGMVTGGEWWRSGVIYQIYPRSFRDASGDGVGDLAGIVERLDHLAWLGVDALWLSPFYPSPMEDFGYDVADFTGVDPVFGTLADVDRLVAAVHARGLRVLLDFVPNHTSRAHPWFVESRSSPDSPKRDWYIWRPAHPAGGPPNNWRRVTALAEPGSAWTWDERTGRYYLASFSPAQPDLDWRNPAVREAMRDALRFWLDRGVDGFRVDMLDFLGKDPEFRDEPPLAPGADYISTAVHHLNRPETLGYIREMRRVIHDRPGRVFIGELNYFLPLGRLAAYYGEGDLLDLPFNFRLTFLPFEAPAIREFVAAYEAALPPAAWPNYQLGNHDVPRVGRLASARARLAALLLLTLRGTPVLYYGDEIGMANVEIPPDRRQDPWVVETGLNRDPARTPMQWDASANAGFCPPGVQPWLPVAPDARTVNVAVQCADPTSILALHHRLLRLRRELPALHAGAYEPLAGGPDDCFVYARRHAGRDVLVALNFAAETRRVSLPAAGPILLSTHLDREGSEGSEIALRPHEGVVLA